MLGVDKLREHANAPQFYGANSSKQKSIPPSNKPAAESTGFKWTEEGMASLLAASHANKVTPPIPPLGIMVREQSLPTTSRTVTTSDISAEESIREIDPIKNLSDNELRAEFGSVTSGIKYIFSGADEYGAKIIQEHKKRFPDAEGQRNIEVLGLRLSCDPVSAIIKLGVEKATRTELPGGTADPTDFIPKRVGLPTVSGAKVVKDTTPKPKIIEGKAINPEVPGTSGLAKEPHLPTLSSDITAKAKIVDKPSMLTNKVEQKLPTSSTNILYKKQYIDTVEKINDRYPINADLAGQKYPLPEALQELYPEGVWFKENGHPNFTPYAKVSIEVEGLTGLNKEDSRLANEKAGFLTTPIGMTWHHVEDGKTMQLISKELHKVVRHTGGAALLKEKINK